MPTNRPLNEIVGENLTRLAREYDMSGRDLEARTGIPQRTCAALLKGENSARLSTLDRLCDAMLVEPSALVRDGIATNVLMSRRVSRILDDYSELEHDQREICETFINLMVKVQRKFKNKSERVEHTDKLASLVDTLEKIAA